VVFKVRIMPTLLYRDLTLVKGVSFDSWRRVGSPMQAVKVYNVREVDELVFLDVRATEEGRRPDFALIDELADDCFMPFAVGGGIRSLDDVAGLLRVGADKVVVNTAALERPVLIDEIRQRFGAQAVVVSIDARRRPDGSYEAWSHSGTRATRADPVELARASVERGAGEILITNVDRDGTMEGYDLDLTRRVAEAVSVPVIASGGCGSYEHMRQAVQEAGASAVAAASIFHFTQQTPLEAKRYLRDHGVAVRM